jgi:hypothetical protein
LFAVTTQIAQLRFFKFLKSTDSISTVGKSVLYPIAERGIAGFLISEIAAI